jgi:flagellar hook protein FlgE
MGLFGALFTSVSGLNAQSQAMGIISNNIANSSTTGYKSDSASFADLVTQSDLSDQYNPGGVRAATTQNVSEQGTIQQTSSNTDLAVSGDGLFVVTADPTGDSSTADPYYTRAGDFQTDSAGNLVNTAGYYLMGWKLDANGNLPADSGSLTSLTPINVNDASSILQQTSNIDLSMNVDATQTSTYTAANGAPAANPGTPNYTTQVSVVDSLGTTQTMNVNMTQNYPDAWTGTITGPNGYSSSFGALFNTDGNLQAIGTPPVAGTPVVTTSASSGTAGTTNSSSISGNVLTVTQVVDTGSGPTGKTTTVTAYTYGSGVVDPTTNPVDLNLTGMNFGDGSSTAQVVTLNIASLTQYASASNVNSVTSDGIAYGTKTGITIDAAGQVSANYSNGQVKAIYQIPLATFNSENSLQESTGDVYQQTTGSGTYVLREANTGGAGQLVPSALEESNVDIANEFSNMIIVQQAYSANSKVISTADQMLSTLLQIQTS